MRGTRSVCMIRLVTSVALMVAFAVDGATVEQWGLWETELTGPGGTNLYTGATCSATFSQGGKNLDVPGFWDGGNVFRLRFSPPTVGEWTYVTRSNRPELDGKSGVLTAVAPTGNNHGPVEAFETFYLRYADGAPFHQVGTTCYAWTHQAEALQEQTLKTLAAAPFNKIRFCVFPKSYTYNKNEPTAFAFRKKTDGTFDFDQPDPAFWRHFEGRILDLQRLGVEADLILWHPYDRWGFSEMTNAQDDRYLRYCIARLSAFRNVWWSLANEYDLMAPNAMKNHRGNKTMEDWDRFFGILAKEDPHQRLRSIHNCRGFYDYSRSWVTHASIQTSDMQRGVEFRRRFNKPVIYDECKYEGNVPQGWGNLSAREMAERFWLGTLSGCYVGHGETYLHPEDVLWWSKGGALRGASPARIQWLKAFLADAPPFHELVPLGDNRGRYLLAKSGAYYLLYANDSRPQPLELAGCRPYKVDLVDPWSMTVTPLGTHLPGAATFTPSRAAAAYRFTPYAPGEPLRPEAAITATPAADRAPLDVRFTAPAGLKARWDFGDGTASEEPSPVHRFTKPGLYTVTLTVTGPHGGSASAVREVLADSDPALPLLRLGVAGGESHALTLSGSAKRSDAGGFLFPDAAPWGWAEAPPPEELRGLRAFTLTGWLRPASLTVGQGGNRILFCLNHNRDGIDLVCHADGRLRLAVNQWPDGVNNDSSPGRLVSGQWTRFAVSYDGTSERDNVRWAFSAPLAAPDPDAPLAPDRVTSHDAGPVGSDIGPLAVGNFNATLRGAGLDRQFRGEIRGLALYGSRADSAGAAPACLNPAPSNSPSAFRLPFDRTCPVFYDNDDHRDVYTGEYLMALAHLGQIRLVGITTTYAANAREYDLFVDGRAGIVEAARRSGLRHIPDAQPGAGARLKRPDSNRIEDTQPLGLPASRALVEAARQAAPDRPLVFLAGGQLTVAADAVLLAPDIAPRLAVIGLFGVPGRDYNASLDAWAWTILLSKCRVFAVPFGTPQKRGTVFLKAAEVPKARIQAELPQNVPFFKWMLDKRHPNNPGPEEHDYDGQAAIALMRPEYISDIRRWRPDGIKPNGDVRLVRDGGGPVIEAVDADQRVATAEFWRALHALSAGLPPQPETTGSPPLDPISRYSILSRPSRRRGASP